MKRRITILIVFAVLGLSAMAQTYQLLGTTYNGGTNNCGTIYKINEDSTGFTILYSFDSLTTGMHPYGNLMMASNGKIYGVCYGSYPQQNGNIFSFDLATNTCTNVHNFDSIHGANPNSGLAEGANNMLYGVTYQGGLNGSGILYSLNMINDSFTVLFYFNDQPQTLSWFPDGPLLYLNNKLYYATNQGGSIGGGTIECFDLATNTRTFLYNFGFTNCSHPGFLIQSNGKLYGRGDDANNTLGSIFSFDTATLDFSDLYNLTIDSLGDGPGDGLVMANNGLLYGTTYTGGNLSLSGGYGDGVIFSFDTTNNTYSVVHKFDSIDGFGNNYYLMQANNGNLYATTGEGGTNNLGTIFSFDISTNWGI